MEEEIGDGRWMQARISHKGSDFAGGILSGIGRLTRMNRTFQSMIQIFIRIIFRSIGREKKHLNFLLFFQPSCDKLAMVNL